MLKKLGSDLMYLVLKTIDRLHDTNIDGYVLNPIYFSFIDDRLCEASDEELDEIKKEIMVELSEGDYAENEDFLENMDYVFGQSQTSNLENSVLYKTIKECFEKELKNRNS